MDIAVRPFDIVNGTMRDWSRYQEFSAAVRQEFSPEQPPPDANGMKQIVQAELVEMDMVAYEAVDLSNDERIAGLFRLRFWKDSSPSYKGNEHICHIAGITVRREYRRMGVARKLLPVIYSETRARRRKSLVGSSLNAEGRDLVRKIGGKEALEMRDNRLHLDAVNWDMVRGWADEGPKRSPDTRIEFYHSIPDDMLEQYCSVYTEVSNQAPRDELKVGDQVVTPESWKKNMEEFSKMGVKYLAAVTMEKTKEISGLTDLAWFPHQPYILTQMFTGVQQKHRGRGLGKWLKAAALLRVRNEFPSVTTIITQNATSNDPMLDINRRLGFKLYREVYMFQIELGKLKKYLGR